MGDFRLIKPPSNWSVNVEKILAERVTGDEQVIIPADVAALVEERQRARDQKDWKAADRCREKIESLGWQVTDTSEGPTLQKRLK